jgi:polyisoprenoid-binding protein YceI
MSPDFLNVAEFPEMTFKSTSVKRTDDKNGKVTGELTLLGVTKPVTMDVTYFAGNSLSTIRRALRS